MVVAWSRLVMGGVCVLAGLLVLSRLMMLALALLGVGVFLLLWPKDASNGA